MEMCRINFKVALGIPPHATFAHPCAAPGENTQDIEFFLAQIPGVAERVTSRLGPDREAMRFLAHRNALHCARRRVDRVGDIVEAPGEPEIFPVRAHITHVGAAAARDWPRGFDLARGEVDDRHTALAAWRPNDLMGTAVGGVQLFAITARIKPVRPDTSRDETDFSKGVAVNQEYAVGVHVGDVEDLAVRGDADVLGHAALRELEVTEDFAIDEIDFYQTAAEFAGEDRVAPVN